MRFLLLAVLPFFFACGQNKEKVKDVLVAGVKVKPIPGLVATTLHDGFTSKEFKQDKTTDGELSVLTSTENNENHEFKVSSSVTNTNKVISVQASVVSMLSLDQAAKDFIAQVASIQYQYADPQKAKEWVLANFDKAGETTIGDVNFQIILNNETSRTLKIYVP